MKLNIYIASKFENATAAALLALDIEEAGHAITYKWWAVPQDRHASAGAWVGPEADLLRTKAHAEAEGVLDADVLVLIPAAGMVGAWAEFGFKAIRGDQVIVIDNEHARKSIFERLPNITFAENEDGVLRILRAWSEYPKSEIIR